MVFNFSRLHVHIGRPGRPVVLRTYGVLFPFLFSGDPHCLLPWLLCCWLPPAPPPLVFHTRYLDGGASGPLANQDSSSTRRELSNGVFCVAIAAVPLFTGTPLSCSLLSCFAHISPNHAPNLSNPWEPTLLDETYRRIPKTRRSPLLCGSYLVRFSTGSFDFWTVRSTGRKLPGSIYRYSIRSAVPEIFAYLCTCSPATPLRPETYQDAESTPFFTLPHCYLRVFAVERGCNTPV
ncbi:hypothetical protein EDC04DRAFT_2774085 [Pisolithus marmoratus]|nr:hypothetical protein EDC04DRAFT_2774085 [Pisolithus marmoratus]